MMNGGFGHGLPGFGMILFWVVIIGLIVLVVRALMPRPGDGGKQRSAREILDERYARGEIDQVEYEQKKRSLS